MRLRLATKDVSRYTDESVIIVDVLDAPAQTFNLTLTRPTYGVIYEAPWVSTGNPRQQITIPLADLKHATHGFSMTRRGIYTLAVTDPLAVLAPLDVAISFNLTTPKHLKQRWLAGVQLYAAETLQATQPRAITGVTIGYIDPGTYKGRGILTFVAAVGPTPATLQWQPFMGAGAGPAVAIEGDDYQTVQLVTLEGDSYIECTVDPLAMPEDDQTDSILIDNWRVTDQDIRSAIQHAANHLESTTGVVLEPTAVTTDKDRIVHGVAQPYDVLTSVQPETYYKSVGPFQVSWSSAAMAPLLAVEWLLGKYGEATTYDFPVEWIQINHNAAVVDVVPSSAIGYPSTLFVQRGVYLNRAGLPIPNFWHVAAWAGIESITGRWDLVLEAVERIAAREILVKLNTVASNGRSNASASRDGVSESWSYAQGGPHADLINDHTAWLEKHIKKIRNRIARVVTLE